MSRTIRAACIQLNSGSGIDANLMAIAPLLATAGKQGAQLIALPENATSITISNRARLERSYPEATHPALPFLSAQAQQHGIWLLCGSLSIKRTDGLLDNRSILFAPNGTIAARYNKIHLFDATLAQGEVYRESATVAPGDRAVLATTPWGKIGMTICYDVRFARLYRDLAQAGADLIAVPAAFTVPTGQAHWHCLLRTRAIETGCFILAPAQCGTHDGGLKTYGHSLIINPWGTVIAEAAGDTPQIIMADLDLEACARTRRMLPVLEHDRNYLPPEKPQIP